MAKIQMTNNHWAVLGVCKYFDLSFKHSCIILAQAMHESANFTSNVFKQNNNAFGMKMPTKRKSPFISGAGTKPPSNEGATPYAKYKDIFFSTADVIHRHTYFGVNWSEITSTHDFVEWLATTGYFGYNPSITAKNIYKAGLTNNINNLSQSAKEEDIKSMPIESGGSTFKDNVLNFLKKKGLILVSVVAGLILLFRWITVKRKGGKYA